MIGWNFMRQFIIFYQPFQDGMITKRPSAELTRARLNSLTENGRKKYYSLFIKSAADAKMEIPVLV